MIENYQRDNEKQSETRMVRKMNVVVKTRWFNSYGNIKTDYRNYFNLRKPLLRPVGSTDFTTNTTRYV